MNNLQCGACAQVGTNDTRVLVHSPDCPQRASKRFDSPYEQYREHNGKSCLIVRKLTDKERDPEVGVMFRVRLETGEEIDAWPEEIKSSR